MTLFDKAFVLFVLDSAQLSLGHLHPGAHAVLTQGHCPPVPSEDTLSFMVSVLLKIC